MTTAGQVGARTLPLPVRWALWGLAAVLGSVLLGFAVGLARPRVKSLTP